MAEHHPVTPENAGSLLLEVLRDTLNASITRGGALSDEEVGASIDAALDAWETAANAR